MYTWSAIQREDKQLLGKMPKTLLDGSRTGHVSLASNTEDCGQFWGSSCATETLEVVKLLPSLACVLLSQAAFSQLAQPIPSPCHLLLLERWAERGGKKIKMLTGLSVQKLHEVHFYYQTELWYLHSLRLYPSLPKVKAVLICWKIKAKKEWTLISCLNNLYIILSRQQYNKTINVP